MLPPLAPSRGLAAALASVLTLAGPLVCAASFPAVASTDDVRRALDAVAASIQSIEAGRHAEARDRLKDVQTIVSREEVAVASFQREAQGAFSRCSLAVGDLDRKIGEFSKSEEDASKKIQDTEIKLKAAAFNGDVAGKEVGEAARAMMALIASLDARQAKLQELEKWSWVPGYGAYLGIRSLADRDVQEIRSIVSSLEEQQSLRNASADRLRVAQSAWTNLAAERSGIMAERAAAAAMRNNLEQRMNAVRQATAFLSDAKQFWAAVKTFVDYQVNGAVGSADAMATALLDELGKPAPDQALILGVGAEQDNLRGQLVALAGQLEGGKGYAALASADCASKPGAAPIKACTITPTIPFYVITNFETCTFRYVNPPRCPPATAEHRTVVLSQREEAAISNRMAKDQNWVGLARCIGPGAAYLGQFDSAGECAAACIGTTDCRFWTYNYKNKMMPGSVFECWGGSKHLAPEKGSWPGFVSGSVP